MTEKMQFGLGGEGDESLGSAELTYDREHLEYGSPIPFTGKFEHAETDRAIVGELIVKDNEEETLGTLKFRKDGMFYEYQSAADGKLHTIPTERLSSGAAIIFTTDDQTFQSHFIPMLAFVIAQHHSRPEELERHISATIQSAPKYGQAVAIQKSEPDRGDEDQQQGWNLN